MSVSGWRKVKLGEIGEIVGGGTPSTKKESYYGGNISWITPKDLSTYNERYIFRGERSITEEGLANSSAKLMPKGTVLFSSRAPIGYVAIAGKELCTNQGFKSLIPKNGVADSEFIYYLLKHKKNDIKDIASGTTFLEVSGSTMKNFNILLPPLLEQKAIAATLSVLDDMIELNNQINKTLEEMAQAIFKSWFVDFEPFKDEEFEESELGLIPKGWRVGTLGEAAEFKNGVNYGREQEGEAIKIVNVRNFDGSSIIVCDEKLDEIRLPQKQIADYLLKPNDTIIVRSAKPGETMLVVSEADKVYSGFTIRIRPLENDNGIFIFYAVRNMMRELENSSNGTIFKNLNQQILSKVKILIPEKTTILKFNNMIYPFIKGIQNISDEIRLLQNIRDTLLPKLVSGEIRVPVEKVV